ncbi:MAG: hypothetical protein BJ554DRAFT_2432, partial [Olpidium bornovanus]
MLSSKLARMVMSSSIRNWGGSTSFPIMTILLCRSCQLTSRKWTEFRFSACGICP